MNNILIKNNTNLNTTGGRPFLCFTKIPSRHAPMNMSLPWLSCKKLKKKYTQMEIKSLRAKLNENQLLLQLLRIGSMCVLFWWRHGGQAYCLFICFYFCQ